MSMITIQGGVCAPKGFTAGGVKAGVKAGRDRKDLAIVLSELPAVACAMYTTNRVKGQPLLVTMEHLADHRAQAVIVNSGNANTCTGEEGLAHARRMASCAASALNIKPEDVIVASTGVIGQRLNIEAIEKAVPGLAASLSREGNVDARQAIMTTDTVEKEVAVEFELGGKKARIGAMAKGSGMIHVNMATMLAFATTDAAVSAAALEPVLRRVVERTFNMVSVDGDTSTNDMVALMANGLAGNAEIVGPGPDLEAFEAALDFVLRSVSKMLARDGEGATKLVEACVSGARDEAAAKKLAKSVVSSSLLKAAMFGSDANWGRVLCAMGYSGADFDPAKARVSFKSKAGTEEVFARGAPLDFSEERAKAVLSESEISIIIELGDGEGAATAWGCDLTYDYVKINGDYRS
jgi:glutamate N-acetyltransferase / amino-acid N-acetyltransferase